MYQWKARQWQAEEAESLQGAPLKHTASDAVQFASLAPGDRVYVVAQRERKMILIGRMDVGQVMSQTQAERYFGEPVYEATYHVIASECTSRRFDRVVPEEVARRLRSERGAGITFVSASSYELLPSSLQPRLWLTEESANEFDHLLEDELVASDAARDLVATVEQRARTAWRALSATERRAVERRAMEVATRHFSGQQWSVEDVCARCSYDLRCTRPGSPTLRVEVKGSTEPTIGEVIVTRNEVALARKHRVDYAIVTGIRLTGPKDSPRADRGTLTVFEGLEPRDQDLAPLVFALKLPRQAG